MIKEYLSLLIFTAISCIYSKVKNKKICFKINSDAYRSWLLYWSSNPDFLKSNDLSSNNLYSKYFLGLDKNLLFSEVHLDHNNTETYKPNLNYYFDIVLIRDITCFSFSKNIKLFDHNSNLIEYFIYILIFV